MKHALPCLAVMTCLALAGCERDAPVRDAATPPPAASQVVAADEATNTTPLPTTPVDLSSLEDQSLEELRAGHRKAVEQGRVMDPADDNAVLYELALRHRTGAGQYQATLKDLAPHLVLRAEGAIGVGNAAERDRYLALLKAIDPQLPALARLEATPLGQAEGTLAPVDQAVLEAAGESSLGQDLDEAGNPEEPVGQEPDPAE